MVLGLLETVACTAVLGGLSFAYGNLHYIALWSLLGWTQLLRTPESIALGVRWYTPLHARLSLLLLAGLRTRGLDSPHSEATLTLSDIWDDVPSLHPYVAWIFLLYVGIKYLVLSIFGAFALIGGVLGLVLSAAFIRALASLWSALLHPIDALRAIATNWRRVAFEMHLTTRLEILPGLSRGKPEQDGGYEDFTTFTLIPRGERKGRLIVRTLGVTAVTAALVWISSTTYEWHTSMVVDETEEASKEENELARNETELARSERELEQKTVDVNIVISALERNASSATPQTRIETALSSLASLESALDDQRRKLAEYRTLLASRRANHEEMKALRTKIRALRVTAFDPYAPWSSIRMAQQVTGWKYDLDLWRASYFGFVLALCLLFYTVYFGAWCMVLVYALATPLRLVLFLPALMYRLSLKASAVTYAPLFYIGEAPFTEVTDDRVKAAFESEQKAALPDLKRQFAKFSAFMLVVVVVAAVSWSTLSAWLHPLAAAFIERWVITLYFYHFATAATVLLTAAIFYITKECLWRHKDGRLPSLKAAGRWVLTLQHARTVLSTYTIVCSMYIAATVLVPFLATLELPVVRPVFFPWNR